MVNFTIAGSTAIIVVMKFTHTSTDNPLENTLPKLIRDRIPEIILENEGVEADIREAMDDEEYIKFVLKKMHEEVEEFLDASTSEHVAEEAADVREIVDALLSVVNEHLAKYDVKDEQVASVQKQKNEKNGAFAKRLLLLSMPKRESDK